MLKNSYLKKYKTQKKKLTEFEKILLSQDDNYIMNLERPLSLKEISKFPIKKLEIFIDDIMCNKKINNLLYSNNYKKQVDLYLKQKNAIIKNTKIKDSKNKTQSNVHKRLTKCESLFLKKKKSIILKEITDNISNFKMTKSLSTNKLKIKNKEFYKSYQNTEKLNNKLFYKSVNEIRYNGYQRSFKNCLERSKSSSEFSLPDVDLKLDDVYSRLYHNIIFQPIKLRKNKYIKNKNKKIKPLIDIENLNNVENNDKNNYNNDNKKKSNFENTFNKNKKFKIRNLFREYGGKEFLLISSFSTRHKCWLKNSGGPKIKEPHPGKINLNKFKRKNSKEKNYFSCENSREEDDIIDVNDYRDEDLNSKLHFAVKDNNEEFVKYFLNKNFSPNEKNKFGDTPLHLAMQLKNKQIIKLLIDDGGDVTIKNNNDISPYDLADKEMRIYFHLGNRYK